LGITRDLRKGDVVPFKFNVSMFRVLGVIVCLQNALYAKNQRYFLLVPIAIFAP
jgi:hypothetical protein